MIFRRTWSSAQFAQIMKKCRQMGLHFEQTRAISTELATALRPFYFAVHPDLFEQHPVQRAVNEESLKQLNAHIEILNSNGQQRSSHHPKCQRTLQFYIRTGNVTENRDHFKLITLKLDDRIQDPKTIVERLLELCNLSTEYVRKLKLKSKPLQSSSINATYNSYGHQGAEDIFKYAGAAPNEFTYGTEQFMDFESSFQESKKELLVRNLEEWLNENVNVAKDRTSNSRPLRNEAEKLRQRLIERLQLKDLRYDCGWNFEHFRGCLKTLERLANLNPTYMQLLRNRIVVFAPFTGVSLEGHVMLFTGDVLSNWMDFMKNIPEHDAYVQQIPIYENTLSQVLRRIRIGRRKFMPKQQARGYAGHLLKVTTALGDYLSRRRYPKSWPETLEEYEIVVESEAGPLMVNPSGQLIIPAACPGVMLVEFITSNLQVAKQQMIINSDEKNIEQLLTAKCIKTLNLNSLTKEDTITPNKMITALTDLLEKSCPPMEHMDLHITTYYSVLADGVICIPWNFKVL